MLFKIGRSKLRVRLVEFPWKIYGPRTGSEAQRTLDLHCVQRLSKTGGSVPTLKGVLNKVFICLFNVCIGFLSVLYMSLYLLNKVLKRFVSGFKEGILKGMYIVFLIV